MTTILDANASSELLILWDSNEVPPRSNGVIYFWNGYEENASSYSLLKYAEIHADRLRKKYLSWIHDLGEFRIDNKSIIEHLAFRDGLSYWWMTLLVEKSLWKTPVISDAIRLLALEEIVVQRGFSTIRLVRPNYILHRSISEFCKNIGIKYIYVKKRGFKNFFVHFNFKSLYHRLPSFLKALIGLGRYLYIRWPFRLGDNARWFQDNCTVFICSYLDNLDYKAAEQGTYYSYYWRGLHSLLNQLGFHSNWLQLFIPTTELPSPRLAICTANRFNQNSQTQGSHFFLDAHLSLKVVFNVLKSWFLLIYLSFRLSGIKRAFCPAGSCLSFWPLMRGIWVESMRGVTAIHNLLWINLFDKALSTLPKQRKGIYLNENQSWERAFNHAWRKHRHGQLVAVAHSTIRFWDLRYFTDPRSVQSQGPHPLPQADYTALNGLAEIEACLAGDYPPNKLVECEALRYEYFEKTSKKGFNQKEQEKRKILILGDYLLTETHKMLRLLEETVKYLKDPFIFSIKTHPNCSIKVENYPSLSLKVIASHLAEIILHFDIVYSSNLTSAVLDAYFTGLPIIVMLNGKSLNLSPLRGYSGVQFVSTPRELAEAFENACHDDFVPKLANSHAFFFLDSKLPRWTHLLKN